MNYTITEEPRDEQGNRRFRATLKDGRVADMTFSRDLDEIRPQLVDDTAPALVQVAQVMFEGRKYRLDPDEPPLAMDAAKDYFQKLLGDPLTLEDV